MPFNVQLLLNNILYFVIIILFSLIIYYLINIGNKKVDEENRIVFNLDTVQRVALFISFILFLIFMLTKFPIIWETIITIIIAAVIAYLLDPLVDRLEERRFKRSTSIIIVYVIGIGILVFLVSKMLPKTIDQIRKFIFSIPNILNSMEESMMNLEELFVFKNNQILREFNNEVLKNITDFLMKFQQNAIRSLTLDRAGTSLVKSISRIILIPVIAFYFILDKDKIIARIKSLVPYRRKDNIYSLAREIDEVNSQFVRGRLIMALFVGISTGILLFILNIEFAIVIGMITTIADIVPYIGPFIGFIPAVILAFIQSTTKGIIVGIAFILIQWIENNILGPKVLGDRVGLNPIVVLLSLIVGGGMFGVIGMIFAVPFVATTKTIYEFYKDEIRSYILKEDNKEI